VNVDFILDWLEGVQAATHATFCFPRRLFIERFMKDTTPPGKVIFCIILFYTKPFDYEEVMWAYPLSMFVAKWE